MNLTDINSEIHNQTGVEEWFCSHDELASALLSGTLVRVGWQYELRLPTIIGWQTVAEVCLCNRKMSHDAVIDAIKRMMAKGMLSCRFDTVAGVEIMEISSKGEYKQ